MTFYRDAEPGIVVFDLDDGRRESLMATYNGNPPPGDHVMVVSPTEGFRGMPPLGGKQNSNGHVIEWIAPVGVRIERPPNHLLTVASGLASFVSSTAERKDQLYFKPSSGMGRGSAADPGRPVVGDSIAQWARIRALGSLGAPLAMWTLQVSPNSESTLINLLHLHLIRSIREGRSKNPLTAKDTEDDFEGSGRARDEAVLALERKWDQLSRSLTQSLSSTFRRELELAVARTPDETDLVVDPKVLNQIESAHPGALYSRRLDITYKVGDRLLANWYMSNFDSTEVFFWIHPHEPWMYSINKGQFLDRDPGIGTMARDIARTAQFAGQLFPLMVKVAGFALGIKERVAYVLVGAIIEELGEEGQRYVEGKPSRAATEIFKSIGTNVFVDRLTNRAFKAGATGNEGIGKLSIEALEQRGAEILRREVARFEGPLVERELRAGNVRPVSGAMASKGYKREVTIESGGSQTWRESADGTTWCRFTRQPPMCLDLGPRVKKAADDVAGPAGKTVDPTDARTTADPTRDPELDFPEHATRRPGTAGDVANAAAQARPGQAGYAPTGKLDTPDAINNFATASKAITADWAKIATAEARGAALIERANVELIRAGVPRVRAVVTDMTGNVWGKFNRDTWQLTINKKHLGPGVSPERLAEIVDTVYHEARHAEQIFNVVRRLSGEGKTAAQITGALGNIHAEALQRATGRPIAKGSTEASKMQAVYEILYTNAAKRRAILAEKKAARAAWEKAKADVDAVKNEIYESPIAQAAYAQLRQAYDRYRKAHQDYLDMAHEVDARAVGAAAAAAFKKAGATRP